MSAIAFQITSLTIVYSTFYSGEDQRKHRSSAPAQRTSNAENVSIWWRHHENDTFEIKGVFCDLQRSVKPNLV